MFFEFCMVWKVGMRKNVCEFPHVSTLGHKQENKHSNDSSGKQTFKRRHTVFKRHSGFMQDVRASASDHFPMHNVDWYNLVRVENEELEVIWRLVAVESRCGIDASGLPQQHKTNEQGTTDTHTTNPPTISLKCFRLPVTHLSTIVEPVSPSFASLLRT